MKPEDTVMNSSEIQKAYEQAYKIDEKETRDFMEMVTSSVANAQAKVTWPLAVREEQKRMTKALRELLKRGWTLSDVIEAEDTMGGD